MKHLKSSFGAAIVVTMDLAFKHSYETHIISQKKGIVIQLARVKFMGIGFLQGIVK